MKIQFDHPLGDDALHLSEDKLNFGAYGPATPIVAEICRAQGLSTDEALGFSRRDVHKAAFAYAAMGNRVRNGKTFAYFARSFREKPYRTLFAKVAPDAPPGAHGLAMKINGRPWRQSSYRRLVALAGDQEALKVLRHERRLTRRDLFILNALPEGFRSPAMLQAARKKGSAHDVVFAITIGKRIRPDLDDRQLRVSLEAASTSGLRKWVRRQFRHAPFPAPPTESIKLTDGRILVPIEDYETLAAHARAFDNCIRDYLRAILLRGSCFYWFGDKSRRADIAIVELKNLTVAGWFVHEILGPENAEIRFDDRQAILAAFRQHDIYPTPQAARANGYWDLPL